MSSSNPSIPETVPSQQRCCEIEDETMTKNSEMNEKACCQDGASMTGSSDSRFSCNICFDEVTDPVVTRCGHLYCWSCLFQWLEPGMTREERESLGLGSFRHGGRNVSRRVCPVSKMECPLAAVVPLYIRSSSPVRSSHPKPNKAATHSSEMDNESENYASSNAPESGIGAANEGLRRRRPTPAVEDSTEHSSDSVSVPSRPMATHPQHFEEEPVSPPMSRSSPGSSPRSRANTADNPYRSGAVQLTPRSPNGHNGSLTYGIIASLQRATAEYYRNQTNRSEDPDNRRRIPSLHDRRNPLGNHTMDGRFGDSVPEYSYYDEGNGSLNSETTQYLTRLLIMLTSFVIFCFLLV